MRWVKRAVIRALLLVLGLSAVAACDAAGGDLLQTLPLPATPGSDFCVTHLSAELADPQLCYTTPTWSAIAAADCEASGLLLSAESLATGTTCEPDAAGRLRYADAKYACCLADSCRVERQGDGVTCLDVSLWIAAAERACAFENLVLRGPLAWEPCFDGVTFSAVTYGCCPE